MSVIRVNKTHDYTVMSNYHLRDKQLSLKAKGLLSQMLSLPDNWDYSIDGLCYLNKENMTAIKTALKELKECGYLVVTKQYPNATESGRIEYIYDIYEKPQESLPEEKQEVENLPLENVPQTNNRVINTNNKIHKKKYGEYGKVLLTDAEYEKLKAEYSNADELVTYLDAAKAMKGYTYKSDYLAIRKWVVRAVEEDKKRNYRGRNRQEVLPEYYNANPVRGEGKKATAEEIANVRALLSKGGK